MAQGSAYATGVLALMLSAAVAVTLSVRRRGQRRATIIFGLITLVFAYTTVANIVERPDGVKIAFFCSPARPRAAPNGRLPPWRRPGYDPMRLRP